MLMFKYIIFAVIATLINLIVQYVILHIYFGNFSFYVAMISGTFLGLMTKYLLDKKYIFYHITKDNIDNIRKFIIYAFFGIFTTLLFWIVEIGFNIYFEPAYAKYIGAILGLSLGYMIKYFLDKRYTFIDDMKD